MTEINLLMTIYNLTRVMSIIGIDEFKKKLKGMSASFWSYMKAFRNYIKALGQLKILRMNFSKLNPKLFQCR
jgi:hypothetical protein